MRGGAFNASPFLCLSYNEEVESSYEKCWLVLSEIACEIN